MKLFAILAIAVLTGLFVVAAVDGPLGISGGNVVGNYPIPASSLTTVVATNETRAVIITNAANALGGSGALLTAIPLATAVAGTLPLGSLPVGATTNNGVLAATPLSGDGGRGVTAATLAQMIALGVAPQYFITNGNSLGFTNLSNFAVSNSTSSTGCRLDTAGNGYFSTRVNAVSAALTSFVIAGQGGSAGFQVNGRGELIGNNSGGDGILAFVDYNNANSFSILGFGGFTASYSALVTSNTSGIAIKTATGAAFTNLTAQIITATAGFASQARNLLAPIAITVGASPFNWTNSAASSGGGTNIVEVYIDGVSVTGTVGINGTVIFNTIGQNTIRLQPGEYTTISYTLGTPTATFKNF